MEGGVLRKEDEEKYKRILGSVFSEESDILYMLSEVEKDLQRGVTTLRGQQSGSGRNVPQAPDVDPRIKAYADQYFKGDVAAAQAAIAAQQKK